MLDLGGWKVQGIGQVQPEAALHHQNSRPQHILDLTCGYCIFFREENLHATLINYLYLFFKRKSLTPYNNHIVGEILVNYFRCCLQPFSIGMLITQVCFSVNVKTLLSDQIQKPEASREISLFSVTVPFPPNFKRERERERGIMRAMMYSFIPLRKHRWKKVMKMKSFVPSFPSTIRKKNYAVSFSELCAWRLVQLLHHLLVFCRQRFFSWLRTHKTKPKKKKKEKKSKVANKYCSIQLHTFLIGPKLSSLSV